MDLAQKIPAGYRILEGAELPAIIAGIPAAAARIGGDPDRWQVREISDGNMNRVFLVQGPSGAVAAKQALPYIRVIGEGWPFPLSRIRFEHAALCRQALTCPGQVPAVLAYHEDLALLVMEGLTRHRVLRDLLGEAPLPREVAEQLGLFMARTLHATSDLTLTSVEKRALAAEFAGNAELCATTEDVIFTSPFSGHAFNSWTTPQLDDIVQALREDLRLLEAASLLKRAFQTKAEALVHGDLHTGSAMVAEGEVRVIDPEWAFVGPMGFDPGLMIGNFLIAACAAAAQGHGGRAQAALDGVDTLWTVFAAELSQLAGDDMTHGAPLPDRPAVLAAVQCQLDEILADALGFAGLEMMRRIMGIAHVADFQGITEPETRARGERAALLIARDLVIRRQRITGIAEVRRLAAERIREMADA